MSDGRWVQCQYIVFGMESLSRVMRRETVTCQRLSATASQLSVSCQPQPRGVLVFGRRRPPERKQRRTAVETEQDETCQNSGLHCVGQPKKNKTQKNKKKKHQQRPPHCTQANAHSLTHTHAIRPARLFCVTLPRLTSDACTSFRGIFPAACL